MNVETFIEKITPLLKDYEEGHNSESACSYVTEAVRYAAHVYDLPFKIANAEIVDEDSEHGSEFGHDFLIINNNEALDFTLNQFAKDDPYKWPFRINIRNPEFKMIYRNVRLDADKSWDWESNAKENDLAQEIVNHLKGISTALVTALNYVLASELERDIKNWVKSYGSPLTLYREIILKPGDKLDIYNLGTSWTPERSKAISPCGRSQNQDKKVVLEIEVDPQYINWLATISNMRRYPDEMAIELYQGTKVNIQPSNTLGRI